MHLYFYQPTGSITAFRSYIPCRDRFFLLLSLRYRLVHIDEGFYLIASRITWYSRTKRHTETFFYTQAPLLPYAYALWLKCFGITWISARFLAVLLTSFLGVLLYEHVCHETRSLWAGLAAVALFASSTLIFAWFIVVKPYSLAGLFLFASFVLLSRVSSRLWAWTMAASGLLLALAVDARSYTLLILPLFLASCVRKADSGNRLQSGLWFCSGFAIGGAPCLYLVLSSPDAFLFNNLGYHSVRSAEGLIGWWLQKLVLVIQLFLGGREANGLQWSLLFLVSLGFVFSITEERSSARLAFQTAVILAVISLLPTPAYAQYFCLCIPFLIVSARRVSRASCSKSVKPGDKEQLLLPLASHCSASISGQHRLTSTATSSGAVA